jgi:hypothetical protein
MMNEPGLSIPRSTRCLYEPQLNNFIGQRARACRRLRTPAGEQHGSGQLYAKHGYQHAIEHAAGSGLDTGNGFGLIAVCFGLGVVSGFHVYAVKLKLDAWQYGQ